MSPSPTRDARVAVHTPWINAALFVLQLARHQPRCSTPNPSHHIAIALALLQGRTLVYARCPSSRKSCSLTLTDGDSCSTTVARPNTRPGCPMASANAAAKTNLATLLAAAKVSFRYHCWYLRSLKCNKQPLISRQLSIVTLVELDEPVDAADCNEKNGSR